jgi:hypothetical protein
MQRSLKKVLPVRAWSLSDEVLTAARIRLRSNLCFAKSSTGNQSSGGLDFLSSEQPRMRGLKSSVR